MKLTVSGKSVYCYTGGRAHQPGRPTLVLIHGAGHDHSVWTLQSRYFATHGWNVLVPDLPGHGQSEGPQRESIGELADWVAALLDAAGTASTLLAGHSMGSLVALETAARFPDKVSLLALIGSVAPMPVAPPLLEATLANRDKAHAMINQWSYAPRSQLGSSSIPGMNLTAMNERLMQRQGHGVLHRDMSACNAYAGGFDAASRVRCPTLLLSAAQDRMTPPKAITPLAEAFSRETTVRKLVIPGAGHAMMAEAPAAVLEGLWNFAGAFASSIQERP